MSFIASDATIKTKLSDLMKQDEVDLPDYADSVIASAHAAAYNEIVGVLAGRGFTATHISNWDRGSEFELDISLFWCLVKMSSLRAGVDQTVFQSLAERRKELKDVTVTNSGTAIRPSGGVFSVGHGDMAQQEQQFFYELGGSETNDGNVDVNQTPW